MNQFDTSIEIGLLDERIGRLLGVESSPDRDALRLLEDERALFANSPHLEQGIDSAIVVHITQRANQFRDTMMELNANTYMSASEQDAMIALLVRLELQELCMTLAD